MAFSLIVFPLLVLSVAQSISTAYVPVYMWGDLPHNSLKHSAIGAVPFREFGVTLKQELVDEPFTVIFAEETLSVEDFSMKTEGLTAYPFLLANVRNSAYLPSVDSPVRALTKFAEEDEVEHVKLTEDGLSADIDMEGGKFLFINFKDAREDESRYEMLRRHNDFMEDLFSKLKQRYSKVVGIYTAHFPSWTVNSSRVKRDVTARADPITDLSMKGLRIVFSGVYFQEGTSSEVQLAGATQGESIINDTTQASTINFGNDTSITLNFVDQASYWILDSATYASPSFNDRLRPEESIHALLDFSYRCSNNVTFVSVRTRNDTTTPIRTVTFTNVKMQAYFTTNETNLEFGDSFNCVGFFTAPIWAGIFVVTLLLAITFYGIVMMMDIRTMDQFDDPKGKTVTINASD